MLFFKIALCFIKNIFLNQVVNAIQKLCSNQITYDNCIIYLSKIMNVFSNCSTAFCNLVFLQSEEDKQLNDELTLCVERLKVSTKRKLSSKYYYIKKKNFC